MGRKSRTLPLRQRAQKAAEFTQAAFLYPLHALRNKLSIVYAIYAQL